MNPGYIFFAIYQAAAIFFFCLAKGWILND
jgi:hypothetical protein